MRDNNMSATGPCQKGPGGKGRGEGKSCYILIYVGHTHTHTHTCHLAAFKNGNKVVTILSGLFVFFLFSSRFLIESLGGFFL